jgi:hypothetical protein
MIPSLSRINDPSMKWIEKKAFIANYMNDTIKRIKKEKIMLSSMDEECINLNYNNFVKNPAVIEYVKRHDEELAIKRLKVLEYGEESDDEECEERTMRTVLYEQKE